MAISPRLLTQFTKREIDDLFKVARRVLSRNGLEIRKAEAKKPYGRVLILVPKSSGTAPERNRIQRQIKELFYQERLFEQSKDLIIIARKDAIGIAHDLLKTIMTEAIQ